MGFGCERMGFGCERMVIKINGYLKIHRKIQEWQFYKNVKVFKAFFHCLVKANYEDKEYEGKIIKRGSFLTGRKKFSEETGLSEQETRTALEKLKKSKNLTIETTKQGTLITVVNYDKYQLLLSNINQDINQQLTNEQPTSNQQLTTSNNINNSSNNSSLINNTCARDNSIYEFYEMEFGSLVSGTTLEILQEYRKEFDDELIKQAIRECVYAGVRKINYLSGVLNNWKNEGITKYSQWLAKENKNKKSVDKNKIKEISEIFDYDWLNEK